MSVVRAVCCKLHTVFTRLYVRTGHSVYTYFRDRNVEVSERVAMNNQPACSRATLDLPASNIYLHDVLRWLFTEALYNFYWLRMRSYEPYSMNNQF